MNQLEYKISTVITTYNQEDYIIECLESFVNQTLDGIEAIVVNDGSTDKTGELIDQFIKNYSNIRVIHQKNQGGAQALNNGIVLATGKYIAFLDGDDLIPNNAYNTLYQIIEENNSDIVVGNANRLIGDKLYGSGLHEIATRTNERDTHVCKNLDLIWDTTIWNKLYRKSFWDENNLKCPKVDNYGDIAISLPAHVLSSKTSLINEVVYYWRLREGSQSAVKVSERLKNLQERIISYKYVNNFFIERDVPQYVKDAMDLKILKNDFKLYLAYLPSIKDIDKIEEMRNEICSYIDTIDLSIFSKLEFIDRSKYNLLRENKIEKLIYLIENEEEVRKKYNL